MITDLAPCPFCGSPAMVHEVTSLSVARAQCSSEDCGILGPLSDSEAAAIDAWNTRPNRATVATLTAEVGRLRALLSEAVNPRMGFIDEEYGCCRLCQAGWNYTSDTCVHTSDCLITRARAALTPDDAP